MPRDRSHPVLTTVKAGVAALLASAALVQHLRIRDEARHHADPALIAKSADDMRERA